MEIVRQPIVVVMGHVDHGKTSLLDSIRNTRVQKREKGAITQHIGASEVPVEIINTFGKSLLEKMKFNLKIPGLLFIDTPGHEAFTNLRKRGGSIADIAILVVDATQGFQPQTIEAINILKEYKTPFIVAMNKVDLIYGWKDKKTKSIMESINQQTPQVKDDLDNKIYNVVGKLGELGFNSDRYDRVVDFTKEIGIIPVSAHTNEGLIEILIMISALAQKFLENNLKTDQESKGRSSILEVKEVQGLGTTLDCILYNGNLKVGDKIAFSTLNGVTITTIRALLKPKPLDEMRDPKDKFVNIQNVKAASGVKIVAPNLEGALPGSELITIENEEDEEINSLKNEMASILSFTAGGDGVTVRADTLGSLEAGIRLLQNEGIRVGRVNIGNVTRNDVNETSAVRERNPMNAVILAFNVKVNKDVETFAKENKIPIFSDSVIYLLVEKYTKWKEEKLSEDKKNVFEKLQPIGKIKVLPNCCFRMNKPAIFGVKIETGKIKKGTELINERGEKIGKIKGIQVDKTSKDEAEKGNEAAISVEGPSFGKEVVSGINLYTFVHKKEGELYLNKYSSQLKEEEIQLLLHILRITKQKVMR
jgi:translation initiation factor 5B